MKEIVTVTSHNMSNSHSIIDDDNYTDWPFEYYRLVYRNPRFLDHRYEDWNPRFEDSQLNDRYPHNKLDHNDHMLRIPTMRMDFPKYSVRDDPLTCIFGV